MSAFVVGQLYENPVHSGVTVWTQPGGVGTAVFPGPQEGERQGLYSYGCQHWANCCLIQKVFDPVAGVQVALVLCPLCTYISSIISPYSAYEDYMENPIVVT